MQHPSSGRAHFYSMKISEHISSILLITHQGNLSTGAIAGIPIGAVLFVLLIFSIVLVVLIASIIVIKKKEPKKDPAQFEMDQSSISSPKSSHPSVTNSLRIDGNNFLIDFNSLTIKERRAERINEIV